MATPKNVDNPLRSIAGYDPSVAAGSLIGGAPQQNNPMSLLKQVPTYGQLPTYNQQAQAPMDQQQVGPQPSLGIRPLRRYNRLPPLMSGQFQYY